jgi:hypothetical protein
MGRAEKDAKRAGELRVDLVLIARPGGRRGKAFRLPMSGGSPQVGSKPASVEASRRRGGCQFPAR